MLRLVCLYACLLLPATAQADIFMMVTKEVARFSDARLGVTQRRAFDRFTREAEYFGAFLVVPGSDIWGSWTDAGDEKAAIAFARAICDSYRDPGDPDCELVATMRPRGGTATTWGDVPNSLVKDIRDDFYDSPSGHFYAYAVSRLGHWGGSGPQDTGPEADSEALRYCRQPSEVDGELRSQIGARLYKQFDRDGYFTCRVVITYQTE